jgi:hypothetical protein
MRRGLEARLEILEKKITMADPTKPAVAVSHFMAEDGTRMVRFDYAKPVSWLALPREQAVEYGVTILKHAGVGVEIGMTGEEIAMTIDSGKIKVDFGKPIAWFALDPDAALAFAASIVGTAKRAKKEMNEL